jgi:hypothetical protein
VLCLLFVFFSSFATSSFGAAVIALLSECQRKEREHATSHHLGKRRRNHGRDRTTLRRERQTANKRQNERILFIRQNERILFMHTKFWGQLRRFSELSREMGAIHMNLIANSMQHRGARQALKILFSVSFLQFDSVVQIAWTAQTAQSHMHEN